MSFEDLRNGLPFELEIYHRDTKKEKKIKLRNSIYTQNRCTIWICNFIFCSIGPAFYWQNVR